MKAIIFGSTGYLGRHLLAYLKKEKFDIWHDQNKSIDITERLSLNKINWNVDYVFLFAGKTGTNISFHEYKTFTLINEIGLLNIIEAIKDSSYNPKIIFPSTRLIYKGSDLELYEDAEKETKSVYAVNKLACENYLYAFANAHNLNFTIFRICVPYGNLFSKNYSYGTIGNFLNQALKHKKITLYGDGKLKRTFTYVEDIIRWIVQTISKESSNCEIFNLPGENLSLLKVASYFCDHFNCEIEFIEYPHEIKKLESGSTFFNSNKIRKIISLENKKYIKDWIYSL